MKKDLQEEFAKFTTPEMLQKIKDCASSQMAECFFSVTAKMAPKDSHFSTSSSLENRVANAVSRINIGPGYAKQVFQQMNIKLSAVQENLYNRLTSEATWHHNNKLTEKYRSARVKLRLARKKQSKKQKKNEPIEYKSGIGIEEDLNDNQPPKKKRRTKEELKEAQIYKCSILNCGKAYVQSSGLKKHVQSKHQQSK